VKIGFRVWRLPEQHVLQRGIWVLKGELHENHAVRIVMCYLLIILLLVRENPQPEMVGRWIIQCANSRGRRYESKLNFRAFSSVVRQMPLYNSQKRGTVLTLPN